MPDRNVLQRLIDSRNVERALRRKSISKRAIRALQTILHELGYDKELNWEKYGADGDYGGGTARAVRAFISQRGIEGNGEKVTLAIARALINSLAAKEKAEMDAAAVHTTEEGGGINFGSRELSRKMKGEDVAELQIRLAGFRGTTWDGDFGPGTELQVMAFQRDYMELANPSGSADKATFRALIAPTWIHMDVRCYSRRYLADKYFVKTAAKLNSNRLVVG